MSAISPTVTGMDATSTRREGRSGRRTSGNVEPHSPPGPRTPYSDPNDHASPIRTTRVARTAGGASPGPGQDANQYAATALPSWAWPALLAVVAAPPLVAAAVVPENAVVTGLTVAALTSLVLAVVAVAFFYATRLLSGEPGHGWLAAAVVIVGLPELPFALAVALSDGSGRVYSSGELTEVIGTTTILAMLWAAGRSLELPRRVPPIVIGVAAAAAIASVRLVESNLGVDAWLGLPGVAWTQRLVMAVAVVLLVLAMRRITFVARPVRHRLQLVTAGLGAGHVLDAQQFPALAWTEVASGVLQLAFVTLLLVAAAQVLLAAVAEDRALLTGLADRATVAEQAAAHGEEVMHEMRSTLGGISSASELLLRRERELTERQRALLEDAVRTELARLGRMTVQASEAADTFGLDEVVEPVVVAHRADGLEVTSDVEAEPVHTRRDHVAEVLTALLHNAKRHAAGHPVRVSTGHRAGFVELRVHDDGPGIPPDLRPTLFGRGASGAGSPGSGLGLHLAKRLMTDLGGDLVVENEPGPGTTFVALIPAPRELAR